MTSPITCSIKKYWITISDNKTPTENDAVKLAKKINQEIYHHSTDSKVYGYAKAMCNGKVEWQVRVFQVAFQDTEKAKALEKKYSIAKAQDLQASKEGKFLPLLNAIKTIIEMIEKYPNEILKPEEIEAKLKKLIAYLVLAPQWPYKDAKNSIDKVTAIFTDYKNCFDKKNLMAENQTSFNKFIFLLSKNLRRGSMLLGDYNVKIITKTQRTQPSGLILFGRIQELIKWGTERILWPQKGYEKSVIKFCEIVARHAYVYKPDIDNEDSKKNLQKAIDRLVTLLVAYDHQNGTSTLFTFIMNLLKLLKESQSNRQEFGPLAWTFDALINNEECIKYMRPAGKEKEHMTKAVLDIFTTLFSEELTQQSIGKYVVKLGNHQVFSQVLEKTTDPQKQLCFLNENQLNHLFLHLNEQLAKEDDPAYQGEYQKMYLFFLMHLTGINKLHFLKPYAKHLDYLQLLRKNLEKLDFSFMKDTKMPLEAFFANGTYLALSNKKIAHKINLQRTLTYLFSRLGENPIKNKGSFYSTLTPLVFDFNNEFEILNEEVLTQAGKSTRAFVENNPQRTLLPVETWLENIAKPVYEAMKMYVLRCLPLKWETTTFNGAENLLDRVAWYEDTFHLMENENGKIVLKDLITQKMVSERPEKALFSILYRNVKLQLQKEMQNPNNRDGISKLTEALMSLVNQEKIKKATDELLSIIFKKMKEDTEAKFNERILILKDFLQVMAPFFKHIEELVEQRFFTKGKLKVDIAVNLREEAPKDIQIGTTLKNLKRGDPSLNIDDDLKRDLAQLLAPLCTADVKYILEKCSLSKLSGVTSQFESVIARKMDQLSYTKEDFINSFCDHAGNKGQASTVNLKTILGNLDIKEKIMTEHGEFLRSLDVPIHFILPNQAIAVQICTCDELKDWNLLIKQGTGQGKSISIALTALNEARKIKDVQNGRVFVFTSYDHLAIRDHKLGENFFRKDGIKSICISSIEDVSNFSENVKIIYADIETIEDVVRDIMFKLMQNKATTAQKDFIRVIFGAPNEKIRVILDEYDLLLHDLDIKTPYVNFISDELLSTQFVSSQKEYCPWLPGQIKNNSFVAKSAADLSSGKEFTMVPWYNGKGFNLPISIMRLRKLIKRAERVIGFSGTALQSENHHLSKALYFEIPASQNPVVFATQIQKGPVKPTTEFPYITRVLSREFEMPKKLKEEDSFYMVSESAIKDYCQAIVEDIKAARATNREYERPVLIFADRYFEYKTKSTDPSKKLWDTLVKAIEDNGIHLDQLTADVLDERIQDIARLGRVTLTTIKYGRGADIRVSLDVKEGLHVIIATPVLHNRLLEQLIGRTGRRGLWGSYSTVTFGNLIMAAKDKNMSPEFLGALHEITKYFVNKMLNSGCTDTERGKWLMFLSNSFLNGTQKIIKKHIKEIAGSSFEENVELNKYYS